MLQSCEVRARRLGALAAVRFNNDSSDLALIHMKWQMKTHAPRDEWMHTDKGPDGEGLQSSSKLFKALANFDLNRNIPDRQCSTAECIADLPNTKRACLQSDSAQSTPPLTSRIIAGRSCTHIAIDPQTQTSRLGVARRPRASRHNSPEHTFSNCRAQIGPELR